jgi:4-hydroxy-4-methyl-2-oxoglutarate aldolase
MRERIYSAEMLDSARRLGSATLHEATGKKGALPSGIKPLRNDWSIAAPVFAVTGPARDNLWLHRAIYAAPAGSVLLHQCGGDREAGYWGGIMTNAAQQRKLAGFVTEGGVRDSEELRAMDFPVFAGNVCIRGTGKRLDGAGAVGASIAFGDVIVRSGDLLVGDADGVVVIAQDDVERTLQAGALRASDELSYVQRIRRGESTLEIYGLPATS